MIAKLSEHVDVHILKKSIFLHTLPVHTFIVFPIRSCYIIMTTAVKSCVHAVIIVHVCISTIANLLL